MRIKQTIAREGAHLVLTLTEQPSGRVLARRVWEDAAKYMAPHMVDEGTGYIALRVPLEAELNVKPASWRQV